MKQKPKMIIGGAEFNSFVSYTAVDELLEKSKREKLDWYKVCSQLTQLALTGEIRNELQGLRKAALIADLKASAASFEVPPFHLLDHLDKYVDNHDSWELEVSNCFFESLEYDVEKEEYYCELCVYLRLPLEDTYEQWDEDELEEERYDALHEEAFPSSNEDAVDPTFNEIASLMIRNITDRLENFKPDHYPDLLLLIEATNKGTLQKLSYWRGFESMNFLSVGMDNGDTCELEFSRGFLVNWELASSLRAFHQLTMEEAC